MSSKIILGAQWGDEGKGKFIDIFASETDLVVRSQGGNNAGHTVVVNDQTYKLHLVPSGILYKNCINIISAGVVLDPKSLCNEISTLKLQNINCSNLFIDLRCHIIMPWHIVFDELSEKARGINDIGTTKKGIGPCYMDKTERSGIRFHDFINLEKLKTFIFSNVDKKNEILHKIYNNNNYFDAKLIYDEYKEYALKLKDMGEDTSNIIYDSFKNNKNILFEGAQGTLLDLNMGTYPYVTSSHPIAAGCCIGSGIGPTMINNVIGIFKAYTTRVGKGPFPTELNDEIGEYIRKQGHEFGTTTGRARRVGWFDSVVAQYAVKINGLTEIIINKIDPLSGIEKLKICTGYKINNKIIKNFPADFSLLEKCEPIYEVFDGFEENICNIQCYTQLPKNLKTYLNFIEEICDCKITYVGVGPKRNQIIKI